MSIRNALPLLLCLCATAHAADPVVPASEIIADQREIRSNIDAAKGRFAEMPDVKRKAIIADQATVFALLEGKASSEDLSPAQKVEASNALERITAAINNREDERIVCERQKATGSNRVTRVCKSIAQIRVEREEARKNMQVSQGICNSKVCKPN